jgi:hypothetical protein
MPFWQNVTGPTECFFKIFYAKCSKNMTWAQWTEYASGQPYQRPALYRGGALTLSSVRHDLDRVHG